MQTLNMPAGSKDALNLTEAQTVLLILDGYSGGYAPKLVKGSMAKLKRALRKAQKIAEG